jgi:HK97 family phage portal protein
MSDLSLTNPEHRSIWSRVIGMFGGWSVLDWRKGSQRQGPARTAYPAALPVSIDTAMQVSTVWACVNLLSSLVASLPLKLYRTKTDGSREEAKDENLYRLLHDRPNAFMTAYEFWQAMLVNRELLGNGYAIKYFQDDNPKKELIALWPVSSNQMEKRVLEDGSVVFVHYTEKETRVYAAERIFHIKGMGNGLVGMSRLQFAAGAIGLAQAIDARTSKFFANGAKPAGVLKIDKVLKPEQRNAVRDNFKELQEGNSDNLFVLEAEMSYQQIGISPQDSQLLEQRKFSVEDLCRFFGVPSFLVNDTEKTTTWGSGIEQMLLGFYTLTLRSILTSVESSIRKDLMTAEQRARLTPEFLFEALLRMDSNGRAEFFVKMVQNGIWNRNEVRRKDNLPPIPGGELYTAQTNLAPLNSLANVMRPSNGTQNPGT